MFDLTDDAENSPTTKPKVVKPVEVKPIPKPEKNEPTPKNDDYNEYDYSDNPNLDDSKW